MGISGPRPPSGARPRQRFARRSAPPPPKDRPRNKPRRTAFVRSFACNLFREPKMRSILLMFLGVPLPIILLLAFCTHHF
jgi:hypothetical protein